MQDKVVFTVDRCEIDLILFSSMQEEFLLALFNCSLKQNLFAQRVRVSILFDITY